MHQPVGQLARAGEQQQAFGVQVQPPDRLPLAILQAWKAAKHRRAVLRVVMGDHFAHRLVVGNHARGRRVDAEADRFAVDLDLVTKLHTLANVGGLVVDRNTPFQNQLLHLEPRPQTRLRQHLVQLGRLDLGLQHTFGRHKVRTLFFGVETA